MQTSNTLHVQHCSEPGCLNDAVITCAFGDQVFNPKGWCLEHLESHNSRQKEKELEQQILRDLGFVI